MLIVTAHRFNVMEEDTGELRNPFPSPPSHYTKYTSHNLRLLALLKERAGDIPEPNQQEILHEPDVPDWHLTQLEKPRVDWILDEPDAYYDVFGDRWFVRHFSSGIRHALNYRLGQGNDTVSRRAGWKSALSTRSYHRFIFFKCACYPLSEI